MAYFNQARQNVKYTCSASAPLCPDEKAVSTLTSLPTPPTSPEISNTAKGQKQTSCTPKRRTDHPKASKRRDPIGQLLASLGSQRGPFAEPALQAPSAFSPISAGHCIAQLSPLAAIAQCDRSAEVGIATTATTTAHASSTSNAATIYCATAPDRSRTNQHMLARNMTENLDNSYWISVLKTSGEAMTPFSPKDARTPAAPRYQCADCKKSYSTFGGLSKHKQFHCVSHVKKEFNCKYCDRSYGSLGALKMHIRTHTLPCKCKLCGKAFSRPWLLQGHLRTHTGEKPFKCAHCGRAFADRSNLRAHLQTHSDVKKYGCKNCAKTFSRMSLLLKHEEGSCIGLRR
ncbi:zinc finger protein 16-like [Dreissena polymorpha]|uniref:zinc finger protein 16-like n=1 Tax=Dreissena polymorpha TaxID=45954 RepID=UPI0022655CB1|nr:zinc finger protein 16-like [Dreissena polymorpha]